MTKSFRVRSLCQSLRVRKTFSTSTRRRSGVEKVTVPCHSNGSITLDVHHPTVSSPDRGHSTIGIYLPRGPLVHNAAHDAATVSTLKSVLPHHIVQVNYRCDPANQYPTPIHDVLAGYDWVLDNLLPKRAIVRSGRSERLGRTFVCGELLGGQLAAMLGLTECRVREPGVAAVALNNPITDWVSLDHEAVPPVDAAAHGRAVSPAAELSLAELTRYRSSLFRRPEMYFDPFASPTLFFRSAGALVPAVLAAPVAAAVTAADAEFAQLAQLERADSSALVHEPAEGEVDLPPPDASEVVALKKRKSSRQLPSPLLGLQLPAFRLGMGVESVLHEQNREFGILLQRSLDRQFGIGAAAASDLAKLLLVEHQGLGLWDDTEAGQTRVREAARWLARTLGGDRA